jgi:hypothetical protein
MRRFFQILWVVLAAVVIVPVAGGWFSEFAKERGLYEHPSARAEAVMAWLTNLALHPAYIATASVALGLAVGMWMDAVLRHREIPAKKVGLDILFDKEIERFVRPMPALHEQLGEFYTVEISNHGPNSVEDVSLRALDSFFTSSIISGTVLSPSQYAHYTSGTIVIRQFDVLHPKAPQMVQLFGLSFNSGVTAPEYVLNQVRRFTLEVSGKNEGAITREFEYDPKARPMLCMIS